jgi:environmental stress-induced protein Ves
MIYKCIWTTILHVYSNIIISINDFNVMGKRGVYFEYVQILCKIFTSCAHITSLSKLSYSTS